MTRPSRVVVNKTALKHNLKRVRELAPGSKIMAIIKADAYGHGLVRAASTLDEADAFGVACIEEAEQLREASIDKPIILLEGHHKAADLKIISSLNLDVVLHHITQLDSLENASLSQAINVWIKVDTGMHRLGFPVQDVDTVIERIKQSDNIKPGFRLMTHLATANEVSHPLNDKQLKTFKQVCEKYPVETSIANSAAILNFQQTHTDWVRPGLMLYGVSPIQNKTAADFDLKPVMTIESEIISIQALQKGDTVGYGATWKCPEDMSIGIVAAGYGDGFPRHARSDTPVLVNDVSCKLIGRASMDMLAVDLRNLPGAKIGDRVELWGESLPIEVIANYAETIPYELLCGVHKRLAFVELD